jgi:large subunit ribosomal protein L25
VNLDIGGKVQPCLIKEAQYDAIGLHLTHLDLARVDLSDRVKVRVPIELRGTPKGVALGGVLRQELMDLEVECMVSKIPESVRVIVADLELDQVLHVRELQLEEGMTAMNDPETVVATVRVPIVHAEAAAAAAPGEPEDIAKGKVEEEGAEADKEKAAAPKAAKSE